MRKPRRLPPEELAPYQWVMPRLRDYQPSLTHQTADPGPPPPTPLPLIDWTALFGNSHPVEIEVGMGKGLFLLTSALARPQTNFFGIEICRKYQLYATTRFAIRKLANVKTVCADARWVFRYFVPPASVQAVHVYFPDPWWKARHKKRRLFTAEFAADTARILCPGGRLLLATDVEEYFGVITGIVRGMPEFRERRAERTDEPIEPTGYQTNFERKARLKGTPVWRAEYERVADPGPDRPGA